MLKLLPGFLETPIRLLYAVMVISVVAGPGALAAAQLVCESDCPMHQVEKTVPPCCETGAVMHGAVAPHHGGPDEQQAAASSCCDGKLCVDSRVDIQETAAVSSGLSDTEAAAARLPAVVSASGLSPPGQLFFDVIPSTSRIPIYLRTCVFLI